MLNRLTYLTTLWMVVVGVGLFLQAFITLAVLSTSWSKPVAVVLLVGGLLMAADGVVHRTVNRTTPPIA